MNVDPTAPARATPTAPRSAPPAGAAKGGFEDALRSALVSRADAPPEAGCRCPDDDTRLSHRGPLSERAQRVQDMGAARRERLGLTAPVPEADDRAEVRSPVQLTAELEAATAEGRTMRISLAEYRALVDHNADTLLHEFRGGWSENLGLFSGEADLGARHRSVDYAGVIASRGALPGFEELNGATEVPAHLQGPDGRPLTVFRPSPNFWNTGGGRYLPPEVSNSPHHHLADAPGAVTGPVLRP